MYRILSRRPIDRFLCYEGEDDGGEGGAGGGGGTKTFTQAELDQRVQDRVAKAERSNATKVAEALGMDLDEAKQYIAAAKAKEESDKSEAQKARDAADAATKVADAATAAAAKDRHDLQVERALIRAGIDPTNESRLNRAMRSVDLDIGADSDTIKSAIEALQKDEPSWFGRSEEKPPPPGGDPKGKPKAKPGMDDAYARDAERAKALSGTQGAGGYKLPGITE